jgi:hypothetical protein
VRTTTYAFATYRGDGTGAVEGLKAAAARITDG